MILLIKFIIYALFNKYFIINLSISDKISTKNLKNFLIENYQNLEKFINFKKFKLSLINQVINNYIKLFIIIINNIINTYFIHIINYIYFHFKIV